MLTAEKIVGYEGQNQPELGAAQSGTKLTEGEDAAVLEAVEICDDISRRLVNGILYDPG